MRPSQSGLGHFAFFPAYFPSTRNDFSQVEQVTEIFMSKLPATTKGGSQVDRLSGITDVTTTNGVKPQAVNRFSQVIAEDAGRRVVGKTAGVAVSLEPRSTYDRV